MKFVRWLDEHAERFLMLTFYCFIVFVIVQDVVRRFGLNYSSAWAQEAAQYAFIYLGWVGASAAVKERAHIRFDILLQRLPKTLHGWVFVLADLATMLFAVIALYWSFHTMGNLLQFEGATPVLRINKAWFEFAVMFSMILIIIRCLQALRRDLADIAAGRDVFAGKAMFEE